MKLHTIRWYIFGAVVGLTLGTTFLVHAGAFTAFTGMTQAWFNAVKLKLDGTYTSAKMCTSDASGTIQCITDVPSGTYTATAGDYLIYSNPTQRFTTSAVYVKLKETKIGFGGTLRIKFKMFTFPDANDLTSPVNGRIYRNGVAVGTIRSTSLVFATEFTEDITGWSPGDLVQVYWLATWGISYWLQIQGLDIYVANPEVAGAHASY